MRTGLFIIICLMVMACKKKPVIPKEELAETEMQMGLPTDHLKTDGYFFAAHTVYEQNPNLFFNVFCSFSDPAKNLSLGYNRRAMKVTSNDKLGNVLMGEISASHTVVPMIFSTSTAKAHYVMQLNLLKLKTNLEWRTDSNISFQSIKVTTRDFPVIDISSKTFGPIKKKEAYELNIENIANNYDSLVVILFDGSYNSNNYITKSVNSKVKTVTFSSEEMSNFSPVSLTGTLGFIAFNYSHKIRAGKLLLFEQAHRTFKGVTLTE